ncbi:MAG: alpha-hydroxy-acid oxidizing protein [Bacillota bacterium]
MEELGGDPDLRSLNEVLDRARPPLKGICRVCPVCDGRACISGVPGMGGRGSRTGFRRNRAAFERILLNLRTIHNAVNPETGYDFFGVKLTIPVMSAPMCETTYNFLGKVDDYEFIKAQVAGAEASGTLAFTGDSPDPPLYGMGLQALREEAGQKGAPIIKPREVNKIIERIKMAEENGVTAVGIDIDAAGFDNLIRAGQPAAPLSVDKLCKIVESTSLPVILKGIMTPDEAREAVECGAAGIVVSNHGGRSLDFTPGTLEVLPEIASAVQGAIRILLDGGVRSGEDVLKAIALGAEAVLVGRPVAIAAVGGKDHGVNLLFQQFQAELNRAMLLTGCDRLSAINPQVIRRVDW